MKLIDYLNEEIKKDSIVIIKPEFRDKGEAEETYTVVDDRGDRVLIQLNGSGLSIPPTQLVSRNMLSLNENEFTKMMDAETGGRHVTGKIVATVNGIGMDAYELKEMADSFDVVMTGKTSTEIAREIEKELKKL